jgi:hypothetical protein
MVREDQVRSVIFRNTCESSFRIHEFHTHGTSATTAKLLPIQRSFRNPFVATLKDGDCQNWKDMIIERYFLVLQSNLRMISKRKTPFSIFLGASVSMFADTDAMMSNWFRNTKDVLQSTKDMRDREGGLSALAQELGGHKIRSNPTNMLAPQTSHPFARGGAWGIDGNANLRQLHITQFTSPLHFTNGGAQRQAPVAASAVARSAFASVVAPQAARSSSSNSVPSEDRILGLGFENATEDKIQVDALVKNSEVRVFMEEQIALGTVLNICDNVGFDISRVEYSFETGAPGRERQKYLLLAISYFRCFALRASFQRESDAISSDIAQ